MQFSWCCLTLHSSISFHICICNTTCSRKSGKKPGCPCRDANLNCCKECLCGKKTHGSIVRPCTNGKVPQKRCLEPLRRKPDGDGFDQLLQEQEKSREEVKVNLLHYTNSIKHCN
eukprot:Seg8953.2 transcript_id=Seg8953.2/GoldUCD/mRNA.D3Y31 product="hypothetical protein" protein_id=Seg8953.2/GoldUCD/D3Y31